MKFNKSVKIILLILVLIVLFLVIRSTYSKYISTKDSGTNFHISKWNILLNDKNISENKDFSQDIQITYDENTENVAQDVIVPTSKGYFEIKLESTGTELPFEYTLKVKQEEDLDNSIPDFKITSYILNDNEIIELDPDQTEIVGTVEPPKDADGHFTGAEVINKFIIYVEWDDSENNILDNLEDVSISKDENISGIIPIELNIKQIQ